MVVTFSTIVRTNLSSFKATRYFLRLSYKEKWQKLDSFTQSTLSCSGFIVHFFFETLSTLLVYTLNIVSSVTLYNV